MKLYYGPKTRSTRALWMLEECGADYEVELIDIMSGKGASSEFLKVNPMGKAPVLEDEGVIIPDSLAICLHLADRFPDARLAPPFGSAERGRYYYWMVFHSAALEPAFIQKAMGWKAERQGMVGWGDPDRVQQALKDSIPEDGYLVGEGFTAADLLIAGTLAFLMPSGLFDTWPAAEAYIQRCTDRPARKKASELDETYAAELGSAS